jgi:hypothetical protein
VQHADPSKVFANPRRREMASACRQRPTGWDELGSLTGQTKQNGKTMGRTLVRIGVLREVATPEGERLVFNHTEWGEHLDAARTRDISGSLGAGQRILLVSAASSPSALRWLAGRALHPAIAWAATVEDPGHSMLLVVNDDASANDRWQLEVELREAGASVRTARIDEIASAGGLRGWAAAKLPGATQAP